MITLKLHALKSTQIERYGKDYTDVLWLANTGKLTIGMDGLRKLCEKYGPNGIFLKLSEDLEPFKN